MTQSEIFTLAIAAFFVLLILSIIFASKNKKLMNQAKQNTKKQKLVAKHYPYYDFALRYGFIGPIIFGGPLAHSTYGLTGGLVVLGLILFLIPLLHMASLFLQKQAKLREAEGDESYKAQVKLIKKHNFVDYFAYLFIVSFGGVFLGKYKSLDGKVVSGPSISSLLSEVDNGLNKKTKKSIKNTLKSMKKIVKSANKGVTYDMLIAEGNEKGNQLIQNAVDSLIKQSKNIELTAAALNINDLQIEGSDSLDNPNAVFN